MKIPAFMTFNRLGYFGLGWSIGFFVVSLMMLALHGADSQALALLWAASAIFHAWNGTRFWRKLQQRPKHPAEAAFEAMQKDIDEKKHDVSPLLRTAGRVIVDVFKKDPPELNERPDWGSPYVLRINGREKEMLAVGGFPTRHCAEVFQRELEKHDISSTILTHKEDQEKETS